MLRHLVGWWPYSTLQAQGKVWLVRSYEELMEETGMSRDQVKRSLAALEDRGTIIRQKSLFQGNRPHTWIRFTKKAHSAMWGAEVPLSKQGADLHPG